MHVGGYSFTLVKVLLIPLSKSLLSFMNNFIYVCIVKMICVTKANS
jgi:hypothetical protein